MSGRTVRREIDRFKAKDDDDAEFTVVVFQTFVTHQPLSGPASELKGAIDYELADGGSISQIDSETFQILRTNKIIRKF